MKKRILALLTALVLTVSCLPPTALAEGTQATEANIQSVEQTQPQLPKKVKAETAPVRNAAHGAHTCEHCSDSSVEWKAWESGTDLPTSGHYYLTQNVVLDATALPNGKGITSGELALCLNGKTITSPSRVYRVSGGAKLTITDCTKKGILYGGKSAGGVVGVFDSASGCQVNFYNVTLEGTAGKEPTYGGAVASSAPGTSLSFKNVTFRNLTVNCNGAVVADGGGAAVFYLGDGTGTLNMENCTISNCHSNGTGYGGAIKCIQLNSVDLVNCRFEGNTNADQGGSAILMRYITSAEMSGCTVTGNTSTNTTQSWAGGLYIFDSADLTLTGKNVISGNTNLNGAGKANLMINETTKDAEKKVVHFNNVDLDSVFSVKALRGTSDPNKLMNVTSGGAFTITYENNGKVYRYDTVQAKFVLQDHIHNSGYADAPASAAWQPWTSKTSLPTSGYYYLTEDVTLNTRFAEIKNDDLFLCLNGKTITARAAGTDGKTNIFRLTGSGDLTICDCGTNAGTLTGASMGAIFTMKEATGTVNIYNGKFTGNTTNDSGAVAVLQNTCQLNIYGGEFKDNTATNNGGAIFVGANATVTVKGGTFTGNTAPKDGGAIINQGTLNLEGGKFTGNTAGTNGGAIHTSGVTKVSGNPEITGNTVNGKANNLYLTTGKSLVLGTMATGTAKVGVSMALNTLPRTFSNDMGSTDCSAYFFSDNADYEIINKGNKLHLQKTHVHTDGYAGVAASVKWEPWTSKTSLPTSGHYYLTEDVQIDKVRFAEIKNDDLFLCLNGHTVTARAAGTDGKTNIFRLTGSGDLTICDCGTNAGTLTGASMGAIFTMGTATGTVNIYNGNFTGNTSNDSGAVAVIQNTCQLNIFGGEFKNNTATNNGGAIFVGANATVTVKGGTFTDNHAPKDGGVIVNQGTLNLEGGKFTGNTAGTNGGAIHHSGKQLSISGNPEITGNTVNGKNSNLYLATGKSITLGTVATGTAKVGISMALNTLPRTFSNDMGSTDCSAYFFSDNADYEIVNQGNKLHMKAIFIHDHTDGYAGVAASVKWQKWTSKTSLPTSGYWVLTEDVTLNTRFAEIKNDDLFLCLNGHTVTARAEGADGKTNIFRLTGSGDLTICDCGAKTTDGTYTAGTLTGASMGAIFTMTSATGTVNIYDGIFTNNASNDSGAVAVMQNTCQLNIYGGEFKNNTATNHGGAIYIAPKATVTIKGGTFTGNHAPKDGGAIINAGTLNLEGGKFTGNTAGTGGGAIHHSGKQLSISGNPEITGNTANGAPNNLYLAVGKTITLGDLAEDTAKIGISVSFTSIPRFLSEDMGSKDVSAYFFSDDSYRVISAKDNRLYIDHGGDHKHCACAGNDGNVCDHDKHAWAAWTSKTSLPTSGYYYLTEDVTLNTRFAEIKNDDLFLCLNGKTITARAEGADGKTNIFRLTGSGSLTICDCGTNAGTLTGASMGAIFTMKEATGTVNIYNGNFTGNTTNDSGAVAVLQNTCQLNIYGGEFKGNTATNHGGAIFVGANATVNIYGGTFADNTAPKNGGAIYADGTVNLRGGKFTGNSAANEGGAIYLAGSTSEATIKNCTFENNKANVNGGAISINRGKVTMEGGNLTNNIATSHGGAIYMLCGEFNLKDGKITKNEASVQGGAIFASGVISGDTTTAAKINISGGLISENTAPDGAGIATIRSTEINMTGGRISENAATKNAGGVLLQTGSSMTISDKGIVCYNTAKTDGGGIYVSTNSSLTLEAGGKITENTAGAKGGGVTVLGGTFTMNDGTIWKNQAYSGGGVYARSGSRTDEKGKTVVDVGATFICKGGNFSSNTATEGGGVSTYGKNTVFILDGGYIQKNAARHGGAVLATVQSKFEFKNGTLYQNTAEKCGGAVYISTDCSMVMDNGNIFLSKAEVGGGIFLLSSELTVNDGKIMENEAELGGAIAAEGAVMNLKGGWIDKNTAGMEGGALYGRQRVLNEQTIPSEINIAGALISRNKAPNGGAIATIRYAKVNMSAGSLEENFAEKNAGAVLLQTWSEMNITGGTITRNSTDGHCGAVYMSSESNLKMSGGSISYNTAKQNAGGVYVTKKTTFTMTGGDITGNDTKSHGGGVCNLGGTLDLKGGKIQKNTAKVQGGGIFAGQQVIDGVTYKATINIRSGSVNNNRCEYGAGIATIRHTKVNMSGGSVSGNVAVKNAAGILLQTGSSLNLSGGSVSNNSTQKYDGAGIFVSTECSITMTGGTVSNNTAKGNAAGIYVMYSTGNFTGGKIQGNRAIGDGSEAGGLYVRGSKVTLDGVEILDNYARTGGGVSVLRYVDEKKGINAQPELVIKSGRIAGNEARHAGGGLLLQSQNETVMTGGIIENNQAKDYGGGVYVSMNHTFKMTGGKIIHNTSKGWAGGIYQLRLSTGYYENCEISYNKANSIGGGLCVTGAKTGNGTVYMKNVVMIGNEAREGAGVRAQERFVTFEAEGCTFRENKATEVGGGVFLFFGLEGAKLKNCVFENNTATVGAGAYLMSAFPDGEITGCTFSGNVATTKGGGLYCESGILLKDSTFTDNHAGTNGGGISTGCFANTRVRHPVMTIEDCVVTGNTAAAHGGGIYADTASYISISDTKITDNSSKGEGGGLWIVDDSALHNVTITGNSSGGGGYALYYHASEYDGRSYIRGKHKISGEMIVKDNKGGDMYMGEQTGIAIASEGLTGDTYINIQLHSGYLTQLLRGAYNYEGGDTIYTVTAGSRSLTDPEVFAEAQEGESAKDGLAANPAVWIGGSALAVAAIAIAVIIILLRKRKKTGAAK